MTTEIRYTVAKNSQHVKDLKQATVGSVGHDLFAACGFSGFSLEL